MYEFTIVYAATNLQPVFTSGYTTIGVQNVFNRVIVFFIVNNHNKIYKKKKKKH